MKETFIEEYKCYMYMEYIEYNVIYMIDIYDIHTITILHK